MTKEIFPSQENDQIEIPKQTEVMLWKTCHLKMDKWMHGQTNGCGESCKPSSNFIGLEYNEIAIYISENERQTWNSKANLSYVR